MRATLLCSTLVILIGTQASVHAVEAAISAPVNCKEAASCGESATSEEARKSAATLRDRCSKGQKEYCSGFLKVNTSWVRPGIGSSRKPYYWARVMDFLNGKMVLAELVSRARTGEGSYQGELIVEAATDRRPGEQHLAVCGVRKVNGVSGPPLACQTVAIISREGTWLRGGGEEVGKISASYRTSGAIEIKYEVDTTNVNGPEVFATSLKELLISDLGLSVDMRVSRAFDGRPVSASLDGTAPLRESKILKSGWRESFDFDVRIDSIYRKTVFIKGTLRALVCRQALGSLVAYTGLDDAQRSLYASTLDEKVGADIKSACSGYVKHDAKRISCD